MNTGKSEEEYFEPVKGNLPKLKQEVKLLVNCQSRPGNITTTGWLTRLEPYPVWYMEGYKGACFKVIGWDYLDGKSRNLSTETL